jgi:hypothetical protein
MAWRRCIFAWRGRSPASAQDANGRCKALLGWRAEGMLGALHARQGARCRAAQDRGERAKAVAAELADELEAARDEAQRLDADRQARLTSPARPPPWPRSTSRRGRLALSLNPMQGFPGAPAWVLGPWAHSSSAVESARPLHRTACAGHLHDAVLRWRGLVSGMARADADRARGGAGGGSGRGLGGRAYCAGRRGARRTGGRGDPRRRGGRRGRPARGARAAARAAGAPCKRPLLLSS